MLSVYDVGRCRDLTPERNKQQLRRLCTTGYDLGATINQNRDRALYYAASSASGDVQRNEPRKYRTAKTARSFRV